MADYTISEYYELPSKGKIYKTTVNPKVHLRSMTTEEEMRRLSHTDYPYKTLCDIIDDCIVDPIGISSYDMHIGDYTFLLHRLRVVTYGNQYPSSSICPICGQMNSLVLNLDELVVNSYTEDYDKLFDLTLPKSKRNLKLKFTTPRDLDEITREESEFKKRNPESTLNMGYLYSLRHSIDTIDGKHCNSVQLDQFVRKLEMADTNALDKQAGLLNDKVGLAATYQNHCKNPKCGVDYTTKFRVTAEFFRPTV